MDDSKILVADADPKNIEILRESLETNGFNVVTAENGLDVWEKLHTDHPDLILSEINLPKMDGFELLERMKEDPQVSSIPLLFLTNRRDIQDRVRSLRGGVKDYMIKPLHVKEVVARIKMILRRMERIRAEEMEANRKLVGRLEEFSVIDLVESFGVERKTGILTVHNENNRSGEIFFRNGAVVNATLGNFRGEKAVYQMLPWERGHFVMTFKEVDVPDEVTVSNLGLLLEGFKRIERREKLLEKLPSPETRFVMTDTFRKVLAKKEVTTDVARFVALFNGRRTVLQIVDESTYEDLKALERIVRLYHQGFIRPVETEAPEVQEIETPAAETTMAVPTLLPHHLDQPPVSTPEPAADLPMETTAAPESPPEPEDQERLPLDDAEEGTAPEHEVPPAEPDLEEASPEVMSASPFDVPAVPLETPPVETAERFDVGEQFSAEDDGGPAAEEISPSAGEEERRPEPAITEAEEKEEPLAQVETGTEVQPSPTVVEPSPIPIELRGIVRKLAQQVGHTVGNLVVLAPEDSGREKFIQQCSAGNYVSKSPADRDARHVEFANLNVTDEIRVELFGISAEGQFTLFLNTLLPRLLGIVVLLDAGRPELYGYIGYLVRSLRDSFPTRFAIALTHLSSSEPVSMDYVRAAAGIPEDVPMQMCDLDSTMSIGDILELLLVPETLSTEEGGRGNNQHESSDPTNGSSL